MSDDWADRKTKERQQTRAFIEKNADIIQKIVDDGPTFEGDSEHLEKLMAVANAWPENPSDQGEMNAYWDKVAEWNGWKNSLKTEIVRLRGLDLPGRTHLERMDLDHADLSNGRLMLTNFSRSGLAFSNLSNTDLTNCTFNDAHLVCAEFEGSKLTVSSFERANLRGATGIVFDSNFVLQATTGPGPRKWMSWMWTTIANPRNALKRIGHIRRTSNPWLKLTRTYSGPKYLVHLLLLVAFFAPFAIEAAWWANYEKLSIALVGSMGAAENPVESQVKTTTVAAMLSGWNDGVMSFVITIVFVFYHACRAFVTSNVSSLRDQFEASGFTPDLDSYNTLYQLHLWFLSWFQLVALLAFVIRLGEYLQSTVSVPI